MIRLSPTAVLYPGDCIETMKSLPDNSIDSVVCDPPYHLTSIVKRFGGANAAPAQYGTDGLFQRSSRGMMGKTWDGGDIAFRRETWAEVLRVLKPGGYCAAFGAPRNFGRLQVAMFDAGFEERDTIFNLVDPSDHVLHFIESLNEAQLDSFKKCLTDSELSGLLAWTFGCGFPKSKSMRDIGRPELGTNLKPAFEPIVLARKPLSEKTVAANVLRWGTGALNIGACRVPSEVATGWGGKGAGGNTWNETNNGLGKDGEARPVEGRWPANVFHDGSEEVVGAFPSQAGGTKSGGQATPKKIGTSIPLGGVRSTVSHNDSGSAARFFYSAKASKADRAGSKHPTVKPIALMQWLARLITPPGGTILDPFAGSGTTGAAAEREGFGVVLCEREDEYVEDIKRRLGEAEMLDSMVAAVIDFVTDRKAPEVSPLERLLRWNAAVASYRTRRAA